MFEWLRRKPTGAAQPAATPGPSTLAQAGGAAPTPQPLYPTISEDEAREQLRTLRGDAHRGVSSPAWSELAGLLGMLVPVLRTLDAPDAASAVALALASPFDPDAQFRAGWQLIDVGLDDLAVAPLAYALSLRPHHLQTVIELAIALEKVNRHDHAVALFRAHAWALQESEWARALYSHDAAMIGDMATVRQLLPDLGADPNLAALRELAEGRVSRYDALQALGRPGAGDLRGWELMLHGSVLLRLSDFGEEDMGGRYAAVWDDPDDFAGNLTMLQEVLLRLGRRPSRVVHTSDRDSEILAWAISTRLDLPGPFAITDTRVGRELVVSYNWSGADQQTLHQFSLDPGATLFAYGLDWTRGNQVAPDVVAVEVQHLFPSWGDRMRIVGAPGAPDSRMENIPADTRPADQVGRDAGRVPGSYVSSDLGDVLMLLDAVVVQRAHCGLLTGERNNFYPGGPVGSSAFR